MALRYPRFMWGWSVGPTNNKLVFKDAFGFGGAEYTATLFTGDYLPTEFAIEVQRAMRLANTNNQNNTCAFSFATRTFQLTGTAAFELRFTQPNSCNGLLGFAASDQTGFTTYTGAAVGVSPSSTAAWVPVEPVAEESPVRAEADGSSAKLLQRSSKVLQNRSDGGLFENIWLSTDKLIRLRFRWLSDSGTPPNTEQDRLESLLDWLERGRRVNYQPDSTQEAALRLMLLNPGESQNAFSWPGRTETDYPELVFVEQLSRI